jgi:glycosyltransferase involved in cell wall biosynthesis
MNPSSESRSIHAARSPMRVLLVTNIYPPMIGGPASFIDRLAHRLAARGDRITVVCSSDSPTDPGDAARPFRVVRICLRVREWYEIKVRLVLLWQMLRHRLVLVNGLESYAAQIARLTGRRYVLKIVGDNVWETARNRGTTVLGIDEFQSDAAGLARHADLFARRRQMLEHARRVVTPSEYLGRMVRGWAYPPDRLHVVLNGVDTSDSVADPAQRAPGDPLRVLFVGRLTNWKGVETLLLALGRVDNVVVRVAGDGPEYPSLVALAAQLGLGDRATFLGRVPASVVHAEMRAAHVLVLTSLYEGLSHTLLECQPLALPAIASNCGGNPEVIRDGENGLLVPPLDPVALAAALNRIQSDEGLRMRLCRGAKARAVDFSLDATIAGFATILASEDAQ